MWSNQIPIYQLRIHTDETNFVCRNCLSFNFYCNCMCSYSIYTQKVISWEWVSTCKLCHENNCVRLLVRSFGGTSLNANKWRNMEALLFQENLYGNYGDVLSIKRVFNFKILPWTFLFSILGATSFLWVLSMYYFVLFHVPFHVIDIYQSAKHN